MLNVHFIISHLVDYISNHKKVIMSDYKFNIRVWGVILSLDLKS